MFSQVIIIFILTATILANNEFIEFLSPYGISVDTTIIKSNSTISNLCVPMTVLMMNCTKEEFKDVKPSDPKTKICCAFDNSLECIKKNNVTCPIDKLTNSPCSGQPTKCHSTAAVPSSSCLSIILIIVTILAFV